MVRRTSKADKPQPATPAGMEKVRVTKEFIQPIEPSNGKTTIEIDAADVTDVTDEPQLDRFEKFFNRVREEQGWRIVIYRLNSFHKDGRTDMRADKTYVGNIVFDPDTYLDDIQRMWPEGGTFKIQSKTPDNDWADQWTETIAPVRNPTAAGAPQAHYFIQPSAPQSTQPAEPPRDTLKEFLTNLKTVKEIREAIGGDVTTTTSTPVVHPTVVEPPSIQDKIIEAALNAALKTEKPETIAGLLQSYLNPKSDELSWKEIIGEVIKPLLPLAGAIITTVLQRQAQQQAMTQANVVQPTQAQLQGAPPLITIQHGETGRMVQIPATQPIPDGWYSVQFQGNLSEAAQAQITQPASIQPAFTMPMMEIPQNPPSGIPIASMEQPGFSSVQPVEQDEDEMAENDLLDSLVDMLQDCVNRAASDPNVIEAGKREIVEFKQRFPKLTGIIDLLTTQPPVFVIGLLSGMYPSVAPLVNNPIAVQVIEDLQAALKRPEQEQ